MNLRWLMFEFLISFLEMLTSCYFITRVFRKEISIRKNITALFLFSLCGALLLSLRENGILSLPDYMPAILIIGLYALFCCHAKWWSALLWAMLNYLLIGIVVISINSGMSFVMNVPLELLRTRADFIVMKRVIVRIGHILASAIIILIIKKAQKLTTTQHKESSLIIVAAVSILALLGLWNVEFYLTENLVLIFNIAICILILCINFVLLLFREIISKSQSDNRDLMEENKVIRQQIRNQNEINEMYNCMRGLKHDLNNHLHVILGYIQVEEYQKAENYIWKIVGEVTDVETYHSGYNVLDALLGSKTALARKENIQVDINLQITKSLNIREEHLTIILGNLYDNAIDANLKIKEINKRYIKASIVLKGDNLVLYFENAASGQEDSGERKFWKTTKKDTYQHGFGIKNIDRIVRLYDGFCERSLKNQVFMCSIRIPNDNC